MSRYPLHVDTTTHGKLTLSSWKAHPLGFEQLQKSPLHLVADLTIQFTGVVAVNDTGATFDWTEDVATCPFKTSYPLGAVALIPGGWLPSIVAGGDHLLVLDRHMTTDLVAAEKSMRAAAPASLLALLTDLPVQLNVLAHVLEGRHKAPPRTKAIHDDVHEVYAKLKGLLPKAVLVPQSVADAMSGAEGLWQDMSNAHAAYTAFLTEAWPHLHPVAAKNRLAVMVSLKTMAQRHRVAAWSLPFLAATVAVCTPQGNPGMRVLKAGSKVPTSEKVYNALADLLHLQLVIAGNAQFPHLPSALLTRDRALAELWVGLGMHSISMNGAAYIAEVPMGKEGLLLADLPGDIIALFGEEPSTNAG